MPARTTRRGRRLGAALTVLALVAGGPAAAGRAQTLELDPTSGVPGARVMASGTFEGHCAVRLRWEGPDGILLEEALVGPDGSYSQLVRIPLDVTAGRHTIVAKGVLLDPDGVCAVETTTSVSAVFEVLPVGPPPTATLALPNTTPQPGQGFLLDATGSLGDIVSWNFDVDGNGTSDRDASRSTGTSPSRVS